MEPILQFVAQSHDALLFSIALIIAIALYVAWRYGKAVATLSRDVDAVVAALQDTAGARTPDDLVKITDDASAGTFFAERMRTWLLALVPVTPGDAFLSASVPAAKGLDLDSAAAERINFRQVQAMPNVLIGLGLFFTFLGLTAALMFASEGATNADVAAAQRALNGLLNAATFKFSTSLVGLLASILFGLFERWEHARLQQSFERLYRRLDALFPTVTVQEVIAAQSTDAQVERVAGVAARQNIAAMNEALESPVGITLLAQDITRLREEAEEQSALLKTFNTDLAASIAKAINDTLTPQLTATFNQLDKTIDSIGQRLNNTNVEALENIISEFSDRFQEQAKASFDQMLAAVNELTATIGTEAKRFEDSFSGVQSIVTAMREEGGRALEGVKSTVQDLDTSVTRLEGLSELLQRAAEPLSRASESASSVMERIYDTQSAASEMVKRLGTVADGFGGIDRDLTAAFTSMHSGFERVVGDLREFVTQLDTSFATALSGVHEVTSSLDSGVEGLSDGLSSFHTTIDALQAVVTRAEGVIRDQRLSQPAPTDGAVPA